MVASPMGGVLVSSELCRSCVVRIAGQELMADLVVLDMVGHNILMDWWADIMLLWAAISSGLVYPGRWFCYCGFVAVWVLFRHLVWAGGLLWVSVRLPTGG